MKCRFQAYTERETEGNSGGGRRDERGGVGQGLGAQWTHFHANKGAQFSGACVSLIASYK